LSCDLDEPRSAEPLLCPSAEPTAIGAVVLGVICGSSGASRLRYLAAPLRVTDEILALSEPVLPDEVMRFAAPCVEHACQHFDGTNCRLAAKTATLLSPVNDTRPRCYLRPRCRWWRQEGDAVCLRCPMVIRRNFAPTPDQATAASPKY